MVRGVSALLITGRAGERKTAVAKAVAQCMQIDPRVYTHTLHIGHVQPAGTSAPTLKVFKRCWKKGARHRPV
ncbi:hypothetical protein FIBSPDRAFT_570940 [Athelia psychrophila]|uniref:Uncharacterized protein n=1 Tax=Athelia psychrophila TaxID=1759441 RepID=A0A166HS94_9AGAM|nr:hypothetical protein FIBSPDRAFT_570940 [Fibularhizoctonia sp. CBS 109695]